MAIKSFYTLFFYVCFSNAVFSQQNIESVNLNFENFGIKEGLSQGMVRGIMQDKEGYLWIATKDGLNKYDGYQITVYRNNPKDINSLPDNYVTQVVEDDKGNFWVGTSTKGLCLFDKKQEKFYQIKSIESEKLLENNDIDFMQYQNGHLLLGRSSDIYIYDISAVIPSNFTKENISKIKLVFSYNAFQKQNEYKYKYRSLISYSWMPDNSFWLCFKDRVCIAKPDLYWKNWQSDFFLLSNLKLSINNNLVLFASPLQKANQYLLTNAKWIAVYNANTKNIEYKFELNEKATYNSKPITDANANKWIDIGGNIYLFNYQNLTLKKIESNSDVLKHGRFSSVVDKNKILWLGTPGYGILKNDDRKNLFHNVINNFGHLIPNNNNKILLSSISSNPQIFLPNPGKFEKVLTEINWQHKGKQISVIAIDRFEMYWFIIQNANEKEIFVSYNPTTNVLTEFKTNALLDGKTQLIFIDSKDQVWLLIHTNDNKRKLVKINRSNGLIMASFYFPIINDLSEYPFISKVFEDNNGLFWFATMQGLFSFNEQKNVWRQWKNDLQNPYSLSADKLFSLCPDPKEPAKFLWIGTNGSGLNRFEYETGISIKYDEDAGLSNNVVYGILPDDENNLWLSTNKGLSCFSIATKTFRNFNQNDGLFGDEFNRYECIKLKNGELAFGGVGGFVIFKPQQILKKELTPNIVFTNLSINNAPIYWKDNTRIIDAPIGYAKKIVLQPGQQMFTIGFSSLEYRSQNKKLYKYYLEGYDKTWLTASSKNEATYTNLDPGTYTFHVTGTSSDGTWIENDKTITIVKLPYWYQTWLFKIAIILIIAFSIFMLYRIRLKQALQMHTLRNNIASDLHDEIGSTLSSISLSSLVIQKKLKDDTSGVKPLLYQISKNTDNMMEAMNDIVWSINTKNDHIYDLIDRMRAFIIEILEPKNCIIHFNDGIGIKETKLNMIQRKNIYLLFKEAVNNIAKYANARNTWVNISLDKSNTMTLKIVDDGIGFSNKTTSKENAGGNGLNNMKKRAEELNGKLSVFSTQSKGTTIELICKL